jgi:hypothetical protein
MFSQISKELIEPIIKSNIQYTDSIEDFEKIELECNQTILCFDNYKSCFYTRSRDKHGEYSVVKVFFYEDFATKMQNEDDKVFYDKCKQLKLDPLKTEIAYKFFIKNEKPMKVWLWVLENKKADWEYDTVKHLRYKLKKLFLALEKKD